jgi:hypothetical protein
MIIRFNSVRVYLHANLTAQRPITKAARVHRNTQKQLKNKIQETKYMYDGLYKGNKLITIPRKIKVSVNSEKNKISTFPMVMPLCGEKGQHTCINT